MQLKKITSPNSKEFEEFYKIYKNSFPKHERTTKQKRKKTLKKQRYELYAAFENKKLVGFIDKWDLDNFIFVGYFAVKKEKRGKGFGTKIIKKFTSKTKKKIILEVEKPKNKIKGKRINFYKKLGFKLNKYNYKMPPLRKGEKPVPLYLMSHPKKLTKKEFKKGRNKIHTTAYELDKPIKN